jgi:tRNA A-37 threonylcarbamoyl transferase component Bud32
MTAELNDTTRLTSPDGRAWLVRSDWASALFDAGELLPERLGEAVAVLRRTASREVTAVRLRGPKAGRVIVKAYQPRGALDGLLRGTVLELPAHIEWRLGRAALARGIPVAEPLAVGWDTRGLSRRRSWIVLAEVPEARDLAAIAADPGSPPALRRKLLLELADLWRALHDRGVRHEDPNLENFLVTSAGGAPRIVLLDLRRARIEAGPLDPDARAESLGRLLPAALVSVPFSDQIRFLARYLGPGVAGADLRWFRDAIVRRGTPLLDRRVRSRMSGALRGDRRFTTAAAGGLRWHVRRGPADPRLERLLADPEAAFADAARVIKSGRSAKVGRVSPFIIKRFNQKKTVNQVVERVRVDRARRNFALAAVLDFLRIRTPRAVAAAVVRKGGLVKRGYLVTEEIAGARPLADCLRGDCDLAVLRALGSMIARLHGAGFAHRDLKATNVLVDAAGLPWLVDLDGVRRRRVSGSRREADLGRLFRDVEAHPRSRERIAAVLEGYRREAPRAAADGLSRRFAGVPEP